MHYNHVCAAGACLMLRQMMEFAAILNLVYLFKQSSENYLLYLWRMWQMFKLFPVRHMWKCSERITGCWRIELGFVGTCNTVTSCGKKKAWLKVDDAPSSLWRFVTSLTVTLLRDLHRSLLFWEDRNVGQETLRECMHTHTQKKKIQINNKQHCASKSRIWAAMCEIERLDACSCISSGHCSHLVPSWQFWLLRVIHYYLHTFCFGLQQFLVQTPVTFALWNLTWPLISSKWCKNVTD